MIKYSGHLRTLEKCRKHSPVARVFYISLVFSNARRVLSQCNKRLRLLYLLNNIQILNSCQKKVSYNWARLNRLPDEFCWNYSELYISENNFFISSFPTEFFLYRIHWSRVRLFVFLFVRSFISSFVSCLFVLSVCLSLVDQWTYIFLLIWNHPYQ